jgi:tetratricopeptide (TPR) repeat protein
MAANFGLFSSRKGGALARRRGDAEKDFWVCPSLEFSIEYRFTALRVSKAPAEQEASDINGVLFQVPHSLIPSFDPREVGYQKVATPLKCLELNPEQPPNCHSQKLFQLTPEDHLWLYVPLPSYCADVDENHPLLQSYVDTVLQGCLEWGSEPMAERFVQTTGGWSSFFLNDTPSSRRPWLYRKEYNTIDRLLAKYSELTHYGDRKHPEEFASTFHKRMKGTWSLPRRNPNFTGRDNELEKLRAKLSAQDSGRQRVVAMVEVAGMGGVGKTQLVTEYCYRYFPSQYGLVVWLNAESADSLVAEYRQLLADMATEEVANSDKATDEIVGEVKTRLFRSQVPWLLIFDNLEDRSLLENFVPRGAGMKGHILVTTRLVDIDVCAGENTLILGCFDPSESVELLRRAAGPHNMNGGENMEAARKACDRLGHLPLALGMAAAYMLRCDVNCAEYLDRYVVSEKTGQSLLRHAKLNDYSLTVASSLSLSLVAIERESVVAIDMLRLLCFLGPDQITKPLLRQLLSAKNLADQDPKGAVAGGLDQNLLGVRATAFLASAVVIGATVSIIPAASQRRANAITVAAMTFMVSAALISLLPSKGFQDSVLYDENSEIERISSLPVKRSFSSFEYEQADLAWTILKSFSLLSVKQGKATMHRLLAEALRASQSNAESCHNLRICVDAMHAVWTFQPAQVETWKESLYVLEHVKSVMLHSIDVGFGARYTLKAGRLSMEAGVYSAMALNAFLEAQASFEISLKLLETSKMASSSSFRKARGEALHQLGRVFRYQGKYEAAEESLNAALSIYKALDRRNDDAMKGVADTLHELGVLEVKKHNLTAALTFLQQSLDIRRQNGIACKETMDADCAATLHQLAAVHVARKPPSLKKAKVLLQEALGLSRQIGQRAATFKQLARVTIREGLLDTAEHYLEQALELYLELYGDNKLHINIAAVKFQQGALALQREQLEQAWLDFSECLRIRRSVYAYTRTVGSSSKEVDPTHLEVSCVFHELGRVAFAQGRYSQSFQMLTSERAILERLEETSVGVQSERQHQARLTNLTWLIKCAKDMGHDNEAAELTNERASMKKKGDQKLKEQNDDVPASIQLQEKAMQCRLLARSFALDKNTDSSFGRAELLTSLTELLEEIKETPVGAMQRAAVQFRFALLKWIDKPITERRHPILAACDRLR